MTQLPHSSRHNIKLTNRDITRINNAFNDICTKFDEMELHELKKIINDGYIFNEKKMTGSYKRALDFVYENKKNSYQTQTNKN